MKKNIKVIKNAHSTEEAKEIGDRWAENKGARLTLADTIKWAKEKFLKPSAKQEEKK